jgi:hypothetical protein
LTAPRGAVRLPSTDSSREGSPESLTDSCKHSIVILPAWVAQTWFSTTLEMLMAPPILADRVRPGGQPVLAGKVASRRMSFIWHFGALQGTPKTVFQKRWEDSKNGYPS